MSFNFAVTTNSQFGAGKLNELHTMINAPGAVVQGEKALIVISNQRNEMSKMVAAEAIYQDFRCVWEPVPVPIRWNTL